MPFLINDREQINGTETYFFSPKHRSKGNANASIWAIGCREEYDLADRSINKKYIEVPDNGTIKEVAYNVLKINGQIKVVGHNSSGSDLVISKHIKPQGNQWHGYPADYIRNQQDKPKNATLQKLQNDDLITRREAVSIARGKKL